MVGEKDDYFRAWFNLGLAYWEASDSGMDRYAEAKQASDRAVTIRDAQGIPDVTVFNSAGWVSMKAGGYGAAEAYLLRGLVNIEHGNDFTQSAIYTNVGRLYFFAQRFDKAVKFSQIAVDLFGNDESAAETLRWVRETEELAAKRVPSSSE